LREVLACGGLSEEEDALQVDIDHVVPILLAEVDRVGAANDPRVVDQDVEAA
jgi:hypothetical protein